MRYEERDSTTRHAGFMIDVCINLQSVAEGTGSSYQAMIFGSVKSRRHPYAESY
jgi:hypothetical protein